jgi:hypothetical protein
LTVEPPPDELRREPPDEDDLEEDEPPEDDEVPLVGDVVGLGFGGCGKILLAMCDIIHYFTIKCKPHNHHASSLEAMS